jgi:hypothetical protein
MKPFVHKLFSLALVGCISTGCADRRNLSPLPSIDTEAKAALDAPVNCRTANQDITVLESEKASVGKQVLSGVRSVLPIAAAAGILMGDYRDRVSVAVGKYNADLEAKIELIQKTCGVGFDSRSR